MQILQPHTLGSDARSLGGTHDVQVILRMGRLWHHCSHCCSGLEATRESPYDAVLKSEDFLGQDGRVERP